METAVDEKVIEKRLERRKLREPRCQSVGTKMTFHEERAVEQAAEQQGKTASEWVRDVLLRELRCGKDEALFTEVVALRMLLNQVLLPIAEGHGVSIQDFSAIMDEIRREKQDTARGLMEQYTNRQEKEQ